MNRKLKRIEVNFENLCTGCCLRYENCDDYECMSEGGKSYIYIEDEGEDEGEN